MMNPADRSLLESLQKAAAPDPVLWAAVEAEVEKAGGVRVTGGAARAVIDGLVRKHGGNSHDQKTHGGGGSRGGSSSSGGSGGGSGGEPAKAPSDIMVGQAAERVSGISMETGSKKEVTPEQAFTALGDVQGHKPVPVAPSVGLPSGSEGRVIGYRPDNDKQVFVAFDRPVKIGGRTSDVHEMTAKFDFDGPDDFYMTGLS
jgi:hypothetical protein